MEPDNNAFGKLWKYDLITSLSPFYFGTISSASGAVCTTQALVIDLESAVLSKVTRKVRSYKGNG